MTPATTTPGTGPDLSGWLLSHRAMRAEFGRLASLTREADLREARRAAAVEQRLSLVHHVLEHHHGFEDTVIWPFLRAANPAVTQLCDDLEADHHVLDGLLAQAVDKGVALRARAEVLRELHAELCRHLDREEAEGKPAIFDLVPAAHWEEWEVQARRSTKAPLTTLVPWVLAHTTEAERAEVFASAPKLMELLYRFAWRRRYERATRRIYGTAACPGPSVDLAADC